MSTGKGPIARLRRHVQACLYCKSTPVGSRPICGQRLTLEADLDPALLKMMRAANEHRCETDAATAAGRD